ncbi:MAG: OmpA family protein [Nitrospiraceae bacterium]|nr:MAG: OmpA family protein [Nitrospiraceae bacterium]
MAIRVDIRDIQEKYNNIATTAGLVFAFGGKTPKYAEPAKPEIKPERKSEPKAEEKVIILVSEPKVEEKIIVLAAEPAFEEKVIIFALEDVHFDFDKSTLTKEAQVILKRNIQVLKENPKADVRIAGYTSASGTEDYNQKLSERRANAVKDYLIKEGVVTPDRLTKIGYGETNPAVHEAAPKDLYSKAAKANMRVLFEIIVK